MEEETKPKKEHRLHKCCKNLKTKSVITNKSKLDEEKAPDDELQLGFTGNRLIIYKTLQRIEQKLFKTILLGLLKKNQSDNHTANKGSNFNEFGNKLELRLIHGLQYVHIATGLVESLIQTLKRPLMLDPEDGLLLKERVKRALWLLRFTNQHQGNLH